MYVVASPWTLLLRQPAKTAHAPRAANRTTAPRRPLFVFIGVSCRRPAFISRWRRPAAGDKMAMPRPLHRHPLCSGTPTWPPTRRPPLSSTIWKSTSSSSAAQLKEARGLGDRRGRPEGGRGADPPRLAHAVPGQPGPPGPRPGADPGAVRAAGAARPGRHGPGLQGPARPHGPPRRPQGPPPRVRRISRTRSAVSAARCRRSPSWRIPTSSSPTTPARPATSASWRWSTSRARPGPPAQTARAAVCRSPGLRVHPAGGAGACSTPTSAAWSTATSSPPT